MSVWEKVRWKSIGALGRFLLWSWAKSSRIKVLGEGEYRELKQAGKPIILLVWHGRLMLAPYFFRNRGITALVSPSRDGEVIARIAQGWRFRIVRGSGSHPVVRAWVEMRQDLRKGGELIIIPDGPRGPDRRLAGCLKLAQDTGAFLVPWSFSAGAKNAAELGSVPPFAVHQDRRPYGKVLTVSPALDEAEFEAERGASSGAQADTEPIHTSPNRNFAEMGH
jgi:lysophospholipid acyltransferase (LPLAT)-like uncharacterized protein